MEEFSHELKVPAERVAVVIGAKGETKKQIEQATECSLNITADGDVTITGDDGIKLYNAKQVVKAIARGFNPNTALQLMKADYSFELIDMKDIAGKSKNTLQRLKGRVIGKGGKAREEIERLTDTSISVYGKTIGIIGEVDYAAVARQAISMLLQGSMHKTVFRFLERKKKEMMNQKI